MREPILWQLQGIAQNNIGIFADVRNNDSLQRLVNIFIEQLKKSSPNNFIVQPTSSYQGRGFYISTTSASQKVDPPAKLLKTNSAGF